MAAAHRAPLRRAAALGALLVLLAAGLVLSAPTTGSPTGHAGVGRVVRQAAVAFSTRDESDQHPLHLDAVLAATGLVSAALLAWAGPARHRLPVSAAVPVPRGRGPPSRA